MKSKAYVWCLALGAAALAWWLARPGGTPPPTHSTSPPAAVLPARPDSAADAPIGAQPQAQSPPPNSALAAAAPVPAARSAAVVPPGSPLDAGNPGSPSNQTAQIDVGRVRHMIADYHTLMGENPVGTNAEIMKQMMGGNPRQATLGPPEGIPLNAQGELVDPWGTPYFFHQLSRDKMEVRSAGPDKMMWTADDVVTR